MDQIEKIRGSGLFDGGNWIVDRGGDTSHIVLA